MPTTCTTVLKLRRGCTYSSKRPQSGYVLTGPSLVCNHACWMVNVIVHAKPAKPLWFGATTTRGDASLGDPVLFVPSGVLTLRLTYRSATLDHTPQLLPSRVGFKTCPLGGTRKSNTTFFSSCIVRSMYCLPSLTAVSCRLESTIQRPPHPPLSTHTCKTEPRKIRGLREQQHLADGRHGPPGHTRLRHFRDGSVNRVQHHHHDGRLADAQEHPHVRLEK